MGRDSRNLSDATRGELLDSVLQELSYALVTGGIDY